MKHLVLALAMALSAACTSPAPDSEASPVAISAADLSGHYRLETLGDGTKLSAPIEVSADADSIWWEPACAGQGLAYRGVDDGIEFYNPRDPDEPQIVCDIGYSDELTVLWKELSGVKQATIDADRNLIVTDDTHRWVFASSTDPLPADLTGFWKVERIDGLSTWEMANVVFEADSNEIWWNPRCAAINMRYEMDGKAFEIVMPPALKREAGDPPPPPKPVCTIGLPKYLAEAASALRSATQVKRDYRNNLVFSGEGGTLVLSPFTPE